MRGCDSPYDSSRIASQKSGVGLNQVKIGRFIATMRKRQSLTQQKFADALGISNKTVSKWECGNGMPDLSLMMPVCEMLQINLNELFSGEKLADVDYKRKAEENILRFVEEAERMKKNIVAWDRSWARRLLSICVWMKRIK